MGLLTFAINVTLDGCIDHRAGVADDELLDYYTAFMSSAGAVLYGRTTYELMESAWPAVARDETAGRAMRDFARMLDVKPKYVASTTRRDYSWNNTVHVQGDLVSAVKALKEHTARGLLVSGDKLAATLDPLGLIDEYRIVVHPVIAGHGPTLFHGLPQRQLLELLDTQRLSSGAMAMRYRRKDA